MSDLQGEAKTHTHTLILNTRTYAVQTPRPHHDSLSECVSLGEVLTQDETETVAMIDGERWMIDKYSLNKKDKFRSLMSDSRCPSPGVLMSKSWCLNLGI